MLRRTAEILAYTNQARRSTAEILACPEGVSLTLRMTALFLSFWGKYATAAGGRKRERVCGGERRAPSSDAGRYVPQRAVTGRARSARTGIARRRKYRPAAARREA